MPKKRGQSVMDADVPCIYADDVANLAASAGVLKFFLIRHDPAPEAEQEPISRPVAQIVMPKARLMEMVVFFQESLAQLERKGSLYDDEMLRERFHAIGTPAPDDSHE